MGSAQGIFLFLAFVAYEVWLERKGWTPMLRMSNFKRGRYLAMNLLGLIAFAGEGSTSNFDEGVAEDPSAQLNCFCARRLHYLFVSLL